MKQLVSPTDVIARTRRVIGALIVAVVVELVAAAVLLVRGDTQIIHTIAHDRGASLVDVCATLSQERQYGVFVLAALLAGLLAAGLTRSRRAAAATVVAIGLTSAVTTGIKLLVGRHRPPAPYALHHLTSFSFPSGHSSSTMSAAVVVVLLLAVSSRVSTIVVCTVGAVLVPLAVAVGLSRPCLGVHYPSDVLAGWVVGTLCALGVVLLVLRPGVRRRVTETP